MRIRHSVLSASLLLVILALAGCSSSGGANTKTSEKQSEEKTDEAKTTDDGQIYEWIMFDYMTSESTIPKLEKVWAEDVLEKTGGRVKITVQSQGELPFSGNEIIQVMADGGVQLCSINGGYAGGQCEFTEIPMLPYLVTNLDEAIACDTAIRPYMGKYLHETYGVTEVGFFMYPGQYIWGTGTPMSGFEDLAGHKVRTLASTQSDFVLQFKGTPIALTWAEVPDALNRGIFDTLITSAIGIVDSHLHEPLDWCYLANYGPGIQYILASEDALNSLPEDLRATMMECFTDLETRCREIMPKVDAEYLERAEKEGDVLMIKPTEEEMQKSKQAAAAVIESYKTSISGDVKLALEAALEAINKVNTN